MGGGRGDALTMSSLQGELSKQMSLPTFKLPGAGALNRQSHDFPAGIIGKGSGQIVDEDGVIQDDSVSGGGPTNFEAMSHVRFERASIDESATEDNRNGQNLRGSIRRKQHEVLQNPTLKTSLTTNIRNIMRNQDKGLLTTSTRLLNA